ncbi:MAG: toxin Bro, partial [Oscillospiraceae bacterium]|nr:toxin Bro [Oscillospiraceae bacterium]
MHEIQIFNHEEFGEIRTIEIDGEIYFVGTDVAKALGYKDPHKALKQHVDEMDWVKCPLLSKGG